MLDRIGITATSLCALHCRRLYPFYLLYLGIALYWIKHDFSEALEIYFITGGASLIIAAHFINLKLCNNCKQCDDETCSPS